MLSQEAIPLAVVVGRSSTELLHRPTAKLWSIVAACGHRLTATSQQIDPSKYNRNEDISRVEELGVSQHRDVPYSSFSDPLN